MYLETCNLPYAYNSPCYTNTTLDVVRHLAQYAGSRLVEANDAALAGA